MSMSEKPARNECLERDARMLARGGELAALVGGVGGLRALRRRLADLRAEAAVFGLNLKINLLFTIFEKK